MGAAAHDILRPDWPVPGHVISAVSMRAGGVSGTPYDTANLAFHVGDDRRAVEENRRRLLASLGCDVPVCWPAQVHGTRIVEAHAVPVGEDGPEADGVHIRAGQAGAVLTADCLPVLLCDRSGYEAMVVHAGWRGLAAGIVTRAVQRMDCQPRDLLAWLGPAIGPCHFEVGEEVRDAFTAPDQPESAAAFRPSRRAGRWMADLYRLASLRLAAAGVLSVSGGGWCTFRDRSHFFSYRRDGVTGRMATLIWIKKNSAPSRRRA